MQNSLIIFIGLFLNVVFQNSFAKNIHFESGITKNTLIELYTSEGCSSCPPAEAWLNNLKNHPKLWKQIIPMAFHVDYWDYIGWHDKFAQKQFSARQKQHYFEKNISQVYTPGIIKNGEEYRIWKYKGIDNSSKNVGKLTVDIINNKAYVKFIKKNFDVHIAVLGFDFINKIRAGENSNKILKHDFVVLAYAKKTTNIGQTSIKIPISKIKSEKLALAIWVTRANRLAPIQITGGWLN